ncbi:MAG TPA: DUF3179 domain-containing (seleno)protein [Tepidisphaeraceae bacterium]|nr:DUF3179 domain-containing (seleno)protein [Tepidisphaeraceae bacterium]
MILPILLILLAAGAATVMAFGTNADLAQYRHGLDVIYFTRRLEWPLIAFALLACVALLILVISNKRRAWWLIALGPITALFFYRFSISSDNFFSVADNPQMLTADEVTFVRDDDWVVGVEFDDQSYALPYQALYSTPVVILNDRDKRLMVMWSPFANVAKAFQIERDIKSRELDIVSMPANALLVYNTRIGQFINGLTGETNKGVKPSGFKLEIPTNRTTWKQWRTAHSDSKVMVATGRLASNPPAAPVLPLYPMPPGDSDATRIAMIPGTQPIAIATHSISAAPLNLMAGQLPLLIFLDPVTGAPRAFDRRVDGDLMPRFSINHDPRRKSVVFTDSDTNTGWSVEGVAIDGAKDRKGKKLKAVEIEQDLYWGVMRFWYPGLQMAK